MGHKGLNGRARYPGSSVGMLARLTARGRQVALGAEMIGEGAADSFGARWRGFRLIGREGVERLQHGIVHPHHNLMSDPSRRAATRFFASST